MSQPLYRVTHINENNEKQYVTKMKKSCQENMNGFTDIYFLTDYVDQAVIHNADVVDYNNFCMFLERQFNLVNLTKEII